MSLPLKLFLWYTVLINIVLFAVMGYDKHCAKKEAWRVPEATLFILALLGGSIGGFAGMKVFRHKTKKYSFYIIYGLALCFQILLWVLLFWKLHSIVFLPMPTKDSFFTWI